MPTGGAKSLKMSTEKAWQLLQPKGKNSSCGKLCGLPSRCDGQIHALPTENKMILVLFR